MNSKGQLARAADVVIIGPTMIYFGIKAIAINLFLQAFMIAIGIGTIIYNGQNYLAGYGMAPGANDYIMATITFFITGIIYFILADSRMRNKTT